MVHEIPARDGAPAYLEEVGRIPAVTAEKGRSYAFFAYLPGDKGHLVVVVGQEDEVRFLEGDLGDDGREVNVILLVGLEGDDRSLSLREGGPEILTQSLGIIIAES
jgi:hypothetical protein